MAKFDVSREIVQIGSFSKLSVAFKPLGLNHFLQQPLSNIADAYCTEFDEFGKSFDDVIERVFQANDLEIKRDLLDAFFIEKLVGFEEPKLCQAVDALLKSAGTESIQHTADGLGTSRKTLLRLFKKHLLYSPTEFKTIVKFRKSLAWYQNKAERPDLTTLAHEGSYYEQSDLIAHFKSRTGLTTKQLLSNIEIIAKDLYWSFEHAHQRPKGRWFDSKGIGLFEK